MGTTGNSRAAWRCATCTVTIWTASSCIRRYRAGRGRPAADAAGRPSCQAVLTL